MKQDCSKGRVIVLVIVFTAVTVAVALGIYFGTNQKEESEQSELLVGPVPQLKLDCLPINKPDTQTKELCDRRKCIWREKSSADRSPSCVLPQTSSTSKPAVGYKLKAAPQVTNNGWKFKLERLKTEVYVGSPVEEVTLSVERETKTRLRLKFYDDSNARYEVPDEALKIEPDPVPPLDNETTYSVEWSEKDGYFGIVIKRNGTNIAVFDTRAAGFVFEDHFLQLTTLLPSDGVYGFGEHTHGRLRHDMNYKRWAIFTRDFPPVQEEWSLYGAQPFYINLENDGRASGVLLKNSNAMDIITLPDPAGLQFRAIGGVLDFYVFMGETPAEVIQQYTQAVGRPVLPPYWSLGFQLSRWDYDNLTNVEAVMKRNYDAGIPQDVQVIDIDYMDQFYIFTIDEVKYANFSKFVKKLHDRGQHMYVIMDPGIGNNQTIINGMGGYPPLEDGKKNEVFVRSPPYHNTTFLQNRVWPGLTLMPDYTNPNTTTWWQKFMEDFYTNKGIEFDAVWVDMNEPASFVPGSTSKPPCEKNELNYPPYFPKVFEDDDNGVRYGRLYTKTLCMDSRQHWGLHYDVHSLYGHSMAKSTYQAMVNLWKDKRQLVLTRSTFAGTGKYAVHWLGDNQSKWGHLHESIIGLLEFSFFGFGFVGADICGFWFSATEEMCTRWMQLGAFYPFARNHNGAGMPSQDPAAFGEDMIRSSRNVLYTRYRLLPFLYTLLQLAHTKGDTVSRALFIEFPTDKESWTIDQQFLWGPSLLITPVLEQGKTSVEGYFPEGTWFNYYNGKSIKGPQRIILDTPLDRINLHLRAGYIIPVQEPDMTTTKSRKNPMGLIVSLGPDGAEGSLYWDDGESSDHIIESQHTSIRFIATNTNLKSEILHNNYGASSSLNFTEITVHGLNGRPNQILSDGNIISNQDITHWNAAESMTIRINKSMTDPLNIEWSFV